MVSDLCTGVDHRPLLPCIWVEFYPQENDIFLFLSVNLRLRPCKGLVEEGNLK